MPVKHLQHMRVSHRGLHHLFGSQSTSQICSPPADLSCSEDSLGRGGSISVGSRVSRDHAGSSAAAPWLGASTESEVPELRASLPSQKALPGKVKKTPVAASLNYNKPWNSLLGEWEAWVCLSLQWEGSMWLAGWARPSGPYLWLVIIWSKRASSSCGVSKLCRENLLLPGDFFFPRLLPSTQSPSISSHTNKHPEEIFFHSPLRLGQSSSESPSALLIKLHKSNK